MFPILKQYLPIVDWLPRYHHSVFTSDLMAAMVVTVMLIPQSLAYALLAGLPVTVGLYASITPLFVYAIFGTSASLSVGPVAIISLMTATTLGEITQSSTTDYMNAALVLALLSGVIMLILGLFRVGFLANFLSHPVISGFITASAILIILSQSGPILGLSLGKHGLLDTLSTLVNSLHLTNFPTLAIGGLTLLFLFWLRWAGKSTFKAAGLSNGMADFFTRAGPMTAVLVSIGCVAYLGLEESGVAIVGTVPQIFPTLNVPTVELDLARQLFVPALLISLVGFVESISVSQTLSAKSSGTVMPDNELIGLGAANIAASLTGGMPVTGGLARSIVNHEAGAKTQAASIYAGIAIALAAFFLAPGFYYLPKAVLAATIIVAVATLIDFKAVYRTWRYSRVDGMPMLATIITTLLWGAEVGIMIGLVLSLALHLFRVSRPHTAVVGKVPGTEHYRNVKRHNVTTHPNRIIMRVDESLFFANTRFLEDKICQLVNRHREAHHFVLACPAVNTVDASAVHSLEKINDRLKNGNVKLHLAEVKGPVMDSLEKTDFLSHLTGEVFLSVADADTWLDKETVESTSDRQDGVTA